MGRNQLLYRTSDKHGARDLAGPHQGYLTSCPLEIQYPLVRQHHGFDLVRPYTFVNLEPYAQPSVKVTGVSSLPHANLMRRRRIWIRFVRKELISFPTARPQGRANCARTHWHAG